MPIDLERINREVAEKLGLWDDDKELQAKAALIHRIDLTTPEGFDVLVRALLDNNYGFAMGKITEHYCASVHMTRQFYADNYRVALLLAAHAALCGGGK